MKHLKVYESFMDDLEAEIEVLINDKRKVVDTCIQSLMDDYDIIFRGKTNDRSFKYLEYRSDNTQELTNELTPELLKEIGKAFRRGKECNVDFHFSLKLLTKNTYKHGSGNILNQFFILNDVDDVNKFSEELTKFKNQATGTSPSSSFAVTPEVALKNVYKDVYISHIEIQAF